MEHIKVSIKRLLYLSRDMESCIASVCGENLPFYAAIYILYNMHGLRWNSYQNMTVSTALCIHQVNINTRVRILLCAYDPGARFVIEL